MHDQMRLFEQGISDVPAMGWSLPANSLASIWLRFCQFYGIVQSMKATIDAAGRIVVPKALRQALGLKPGQPLEIRAGDGRLEIEIASTPMRLQKRGKGIVAVPDTELPTLTAENVRDTLERVRR
jgi:AbrB family looped-hinge helix DNA binding protein